MIPFSQFKPTSKKFVALKLDKPSTQAMIFWCAENGFDTTKGYDGEDTDSFDFHITVYYTDNEVQMASNVLYIKPIQFTFSELALFGENHNIPVLKVIPNDGLMKIRNIFSDLGLTDKWGDWKPHVSVSYNYNGTDNDLFNVKLPVFPVFVDTLIIEDQK